MKKYLLLSSLLLASILLMAQKPIAKFEKHTHDFGSIQETNGKTSYNFEFKNIGKKDFLITEVKSSCGCTAPKWSKKPIPPGGTGSILVSYDPKNRPGPFTKTITISNNSEESKLLLYIKGDVIPDPKKVKKHLENKVKKQSKGEK